MLIHVRRAAEPRTPENKLLKHSWKSFAGEVADHSSAKAGRQQSRKAHLAPWLVVENTVGLTALETTRPACGCKANLCSDTVTWARLLQWEVFLHCLAGMEEFQSMLGLYIIIPYLSLFQMLDRMLPANPAQYHSASFTATQALSKLRH